MFLSLSSLDESLLASGLWHGIWQRVSGAGTIVCTCFSAVPNGYVGGASGCLDPNADGYFL